MSERQFGGETPDPNQTMTRARAVLGSSVGMALVRLTNMGLGFALSVLLARTLGLEGFGTYAFAFAIAGLMGFVTQLGLPVLIVRESARALAGDPQGAGAGRFVAIASWSAMVVAVAAALLLAGTLLVALGLSVSMLDGGAWMLPLAAVLATMMGFMAAGGALLNGQTKPLKGSVADGALRPFVFLVLVWASASTLTPQSAMAAHVMAALCGAVLVWGLSAPALLRARAVSTTQERRWMSRTWIQSLIPFSLNTGLRVLNSRLDVLMVGLLVGPAEVALYAVANQLANFGVMGQTIVNAQAAPRLAAALARDDKPSAQHAVSLCALAAGTIGLAILGGVVLVGAPILRLAFGEAFASAFGVLVILALVQAITSAMGPTALTLNMAGLERLTLRVSAISVGVNAVLNIPLVLAFGAEGAALSLLIAVAVGQTLMMRYAAQRTGLTTHVVFALRSARVRHDLRRILWRS
ncbi:MAG: oligosaccharide flippase family protein [Pseudomonadota bacterium]